MPSKTSDDHPERPDGAAPRTSRSDSSGADEDSGSFESTNLPLGEGPGVAEFAATERDEARALILRGLEEDVPEGDITTEWLVPQDVELEARFVPRQDGIVCGIPVVAMLFREVEPAISLRPLRSDGDRLVRGEPFLEIEGPAQSILRGERLALNFLQRLGGIATLTRRFVESIDGTGCRLFDTRKTTPAWRNLEKYAVRVGGGHNHRRNLSESALIKDNHRHVLGSIGERDVGEWVRRIRDHRPGAMVELEVDGLDELQEALNARVDIVLLDNFSVDQLREAVTRTRELGGEKPLLEASGGIDLKTVRAVAETGVDRVAVGEITHSAPSVDIGLDVVGVSR